MNVARLRTPPDTTPEDAQVFTLHLPLAKVAPAAPLESAER